MGETISRPAASFADAETADHNNTDAKNTAQEGKLGKATETEADLFVLLEIDDPTYNEMVSSWPDDHLVFDSSSEDEVEVGSGNEADDEKDRDESREEERQNALLKQSLSLGPGVFTVKRENESENAGPDPTSIENFRAGVEEKLLLLQKTQSQKQRRPPPEFEWWDVAFTEEEKAMSRKEWESAIDRMVEAVKEKEKGEKEKELEKIKKKEKRRRRKARRQEKRAEEMEATVGKKGERT
ncbi:hypothetical protein F5Y16DRAFT_381566 [Xylariaceae sp. FL0255]|nr:hypothetical protein F5Y16DRAFT_381566 [Xylariaceae sp. FL0255]